MTERTRDRGLGLLLAGLGGLLLVWLVPAYVVSPGGGALVLRPDFWPTILAWALIAAGLGLAAHAHLSPPHPGAEGTGTGTGPSGGWLRVGWLAAVMVGLSLAVPSLGMVWACMLAGLALLPAVRPERPVAAVLVSLGLPLLLYGFFAKFAGVSVPQGDYLWLP